jgi:hypothetical protein
VDAACQRTNDIACGRRSRVVLTPRRWRQVLEKQASCRLLGDDGGKKARSPGRARNKPLKPSRAGMPGDPGATVVTNACAFYHCARGCGCIGHPAFPTPSLGEGVTHNSGAMRSGNAETCLRSPDAAQHAALRRDALLIRGPCSAPMVPALRCIVKNAAPRPGHVFASLAMTVSRLFDNGIRDHGWRASASYSASSRP